MNYARLEHALNHLASGSATEGPMYRMAGALQNILNDKGTTPDQKAEKLAELIEECIEQGK